MQRLNMKMFIFVLLTGLLLAGCTHKKSSSDVTLFARVGEDASRFIESSLEGNSIHFGLVNCGEIVFSGHSDPEHTKIFFSHGKSNTGTELVLSDINADGIPDYWLVIDPESENIKKIKVDPINIPKIE